MVCAPSPWNRAHRGEDEDLKERDGGGCDADEELREDYGICRGLWVGEDDEEVEEGGWEGERRDERVEGAKEEGEGCALSESSKKTVAEAGATAEGVWKGEFGGGADEGPELDWGGVLVGVLRAGAWRREDKWLTATSHM